LRILFLSGQLSAHLLFDYPSTIRIACDLLRVEILALHNLFCVSAGYTTRYNFKALLLTCSE
jgi:hypothetical protein